MEKLINLTLDQFKERIEYERVIFNCGGIEPFLIDDYNEMNIQLETEGLNDHEKFLLFVIAYNMTGTCPFKRFVMEKFGWTAYKVQKMFRELKPYGLECVPTFSEQTGLISGSGYMVYNLKNL